MSSLYSEVFSVKYKSFQEWKIQNQDVVFTRNYCRKEIAASIVKQICKITLYGLSILYTISMIIKTFNSYCCHNRFFLQMSISYRILNS
jgi:hypothetical protein